MDKVFSMSKFMTRGDLLEAKAKYYEDKCKKMKDEIQNLIDTSIVENVVRPDGQGIIVCLTVLEDSLQKLVDM
jgi:hypothetical protein